MLASAPLPLVHLVGSVPYDTAESTFTRALEKLQGRLQTLPDGEPGERGNFVFWQSKTFPADILYNHFYPPDVKIDKDFQLKAEDIEPTGYDDAAVASYSEFCRLRDTGVIPQGVRFQVSLPTPLNSGSVWVDPKYTAQAEMFYEQRILSALANIQAKIPAQDLAIQWDLAIEMAHMEHAYGPSRPEFQLFKPAYSPVKEGVVERVTRLANAVDKDVPIGFHLCYGDFEHKHFVEPKDTAQLVNLINGLSDSITKTRSVNWFHLPVPKSRVDDAYYEPLSQLKISSEATLFLGLVHAHDLEGTQQRISVAKKALGSKEFGVSTECGLGQTPSGDLESIFQIYKEITE